MRALLQLSKRISRALVFSSSSYSSLTSSRTFATLSLFSPDCNSAAITTNGNVYARPWLAIQHRGVKVNAIHLRPGNVIEKSGRIFEVVDAEHKQRGRGGAILTWKQANLTLWCRGGC
uniref:Translation elongation factor KOW-like domain-containing protein n=1 Tax=Salix viminalis TaxID=40686 RepID=A0A6N2M9K5_SALVM